MVRRLIQIKHKTPRRCTDAVINLLREVLPAHHRFPPNIWTALRGDGTKGVSQLRAVQVKFCAQGPMPSQTGRKEQLCNNPTVYYGVEQSTTDPPGPALDKAQLPNCSTCGSDRSKEKTTHLIPVREHIQVSALSPGSGCTALHHPRAVLRHDGSQGCMVAHADDCALRRRRRRCCCCSAVLPCAATVWGCRQSLWRRRDLRVYLQKSFKDWSSEASAVQPDVVHSRAFATHCEPFISGAGYRNVVLLLYADGVSVAKKSDSSMFVITAQVVNLPPDKRRHLDNMLLLQIIPGPKTPKSLHDLLRPLVDELKTLYNDGVTIDTGDNETCNIRVMFLSIIADARAHPKLTMMMQTPAIYPCHLCELKVATATHTAHASTGAVLGTSLAGAMAISCH